MVRNRRLPTGFSTYYCFGHRATMAAILDMRKYPPHCPRPSTNSPIHPRADSTPHPRYRPHTLASSPPSELTPYSLPPSFKVRGDVFLSSVGSLRFSSTSHFFPGENLDNRQTFLRFVLLFITRVRIIFFCSRDKVEVNTNEIYMFVEIRNFIDQHDTRVTCLNFFIRFSSIERRNENRANKKGVFEGRVSVTEKVFLR